MITFLIIHSLIPAIGLVVFLFLAKRMTQADLPGGLVLELFLLFATYGGLLLVVLTSLFWQWSGMPLLGVLYLVFVAPLIMAYIIYREYRNRTASTYHKWIALSSGIYLIIMPALLIVARFMIRV